MSEKVEKEVNYIFKNKKLLNKALTHSSYSNEKDNCEDNERLEFLGDAVLELIVSEYLYKKYEDIDEGELTKIRANIVCEISLAEVAKNINLGKSLNMGNGEESTGGRDRDSILADALEAVIGAIFIDGGIESAKMMIISLILGDLEEKRKKTSINDYKSLLQETLQKHSTEVIIYDIINESGPDHNKLFTAQVSHHSKILGKGQGKTKKEAEQNAALDALNNNRLDV